MIKRYLNPFITNIRARFSEYLAKKRLLKLPLLENPLFIIVMPGGLHLAHLAMRFIPKNHNKVVILNGMSHWECSWARCRMLTNHYIEIPFSLRHSEIIDLLFETIPGNFGIMDYDCFVFREELFSEIATISNDCALNAIFLRNNSELGIDVPETFFLFFNTKLVNELRTKYGIGAGPMKWDSLPEKVKRAFASIGLSSECLPETHKRYFDTLRVLMMLSKVEGKSYHFVEHLPASPTPSEIAFHVGGVSNPASMNNIWDFRGSYFWYRVLEKTKDDELHWAYSRKFPKTTAAKLLKEQSIEKSDDLKNFINYCEYLIDIGHSSYDKPIM